MPTLVVADTSVLQYLYQLGRLALLEQLYGLIYIPNAVAAEIGIGQERGISLPDLKATPYIKVVAAPDISLPSDCDKLDLGELQVLKLAFATQATWTLLDDGAAREAALALGLPHTGCLGILLRAYRLGAIPDLARELTSLQTLGFRLAPATLKSVLSEI